jgi:NAD+ synthase (glutamine-hydrolysing)
MKDGQVLGIYNKHNLPNYGVFDEKRYFNEGHQHLVFEYLGHKFGVLICEDIWSINTVKQVAQLNVDSIVILNASPYEVGKPQHRVQTLTELSKQFNVNLIYVNQVGGQDDLIFDGSSFIINHDSSWHLKHLALKKLFISQTLILKIKSLMWLIHRQIWMRLLKSIKVWSWQPVTMFSVQVFQV